jgi:hypothetical protein
LNCLDRDTAGQNSSWPLPKRGSIAFCWRFFVESTPALQSEKQFTIGDHMNKKTILLTFAVLAVVGLCFAAASDAFMGTWQLNEAKSKMAAGGGKNSTVTYSMSGDEITCTIEGTDASGQPLHTSWTGKFDGKDYPVTGDPSSDMRSYRLISSHTVLATDKKDGKVIETARVTISADGKSRTVTIHGRDAKGMRTTTIAVYDKQ